MDDFLYSEDNNMLSFLDDHLRPNDLLDSKDNEPPTCTAGRKMNHSSSNSVENEKSKADSNHKQGGGVMSSSFLAAVVDEM